MWIKCSLEHAIRDYFVESYSSENRYCEEVLKMSKNLLKKGSVTVMF